MALKPTGHDEIDRQHRVLCALLDQLNQFCVDHDAHSSACSECPSQHLNACRQKLSTIAGEVLAAFLLHTRYEERLMEMLPDQPHCHNHVTAHKCSHSKISGRLSTLTCGLDSTNPKEVSQSLHNIIGEIVGDHVSLFDEVLAFESEGIVSAKNLGKDLFSMIGDYPSNLLSAEPQISCQNILSEHDSDILQRFNSLTNKQHEICQMIADGVMNKNIADRMGTSINTIKTHRASIIAKMGAKSLLDLSRKVNGLRNIGILSKRGSISNVDSSSTSSQSANLFNVIVVEDNPALRQAMISGLSALGHTVRGAVDGVALDQELQKAAADIVVLDIGLGEGREDGFAIAARLRRSLRCAIIMLTARCEIDARIRGLESGADAYVVKPFDFGELSAVMGSVMRRIRSTEFVR